MTWARVFMDSTNFVGMCNPLGLFASVATFKPEALPEVGLGSVAIPAMYRAAMKGSLRPALYEGWKFPFVLGYGTTHPTYKQIRDMVGILDEELRRT